MGMTTLEIQLSKGINVFDIFDNPKLKFGFSIYTYRFENESEESWHERDERNFQRALKLKHKIKN
jgi:hypothetical protein